MLFYLAFTIGLGLHFSRESSESRVAAGETVILLHSLSTFRTGVSIAMERGHQQNDSLADGRNYLQLGHDLPSFTPDAIPPPPHTTNTVRYDEYTRAP